MKNVMSIRLEPKSLRRVRELAKRDRKDVSTVARELIDNGLVFVTLRDYRAGRLSLGLLAERLGMTLSEAIDLLAEIGVRSPIGHDDYLRSYASAQQFVARR
jgi:predicted transcriptional regulator